MTDTTISDITQIALRKLEKAFGDAISRSSGSFGGQGRTNTPESSGSTGDSGGQSRSESRSNSRANREARDGLENLGESAGDLSDIMSGVNKGFREQQRGLKANYTALDSLTNGYGNSIKAQSQSLSGLMDHYQRSNEAVDIMTEKLFKTSSTLKIMNKYLSSTASTNRDLEEAQSKASSSAMLLEHAMKSHKGATAALINGLAEIQKSNSRTLTQQEKNLVATAKEAGLIGKSNAAYQEHIDGVKSDLKALQKTAAAHLKMQDAIGKIHDKFGALGKAMTGALSPMGMVTAGLSLFASSLQGAWDQFKIIADSGMVREWGSIKRAQFELGISFEHATKLFQENARIVGSVGGTKFQAALLSSQENLTRYGMGLEDATAATAEFASNAVKGGIDIGNTDKLNKSIKAQSNAFLKMHAVSGVSITEFKAMNSEMMSNSAVQETLNGLNQDERASKIEGMMKLRQTFTNMGMSAQTAQKAMMSLQDIGKQKVSDRFEQAAKIQQAAAISGLSNGQQLADIYRKGKRASAAEQKILQQGAGDMARSMDQMSMGSYGLENVANMLEENLQGPFAQLMDAGREQKLAADAMGKVSEKQAELLKDSMRLNDLAFGALVKEGQIKQVITDPIVKGIAGLAIALMGLGIMLTRGGLNAIKTSTAGILTFLQANIAKVTATHTPPTPDANPERPTADRLRASHRRRHTARTTVSGGDGIGTGTLPEVLMNASKINTPFLDAVKMHTAVLYVDKIIEKGGSSDRSSRRNKGPRVNPPSVDDSILNSSGVNNPDAPSRRRRNRISSETRAHLNAEGGINSHVDRIQPIGERLNGHAGRAANSVRGAGRGIAGAAAKGLGGIAKVAGKLFAPIAIITSIYGAVENAMNAEDVLGMDKTQGQSATIGQRVIVGMMGVLKGLTFGIFDGVLDDATRFLAGGEVMGPLNKGIETVVDFFGHAWIKIGGYFTLMGEMFKSGASEVSSWADNPVMGFILKWVKIGFGSFIDGWKGIEGLIGDLADWVLKGGIIKGIMNSMVFMKDTVMHGFMEVKENFQIISNILTHANTDIKSELALGISKIVQVKNYVSLWWYSMLSTLLGTVASIIDNPLMKKLIPEETVKSIIDSSTAATERAVQAQTVIDDNNKLQDTIRKDLDTSHIDEISKIQQASDKERKDHDKKSALETEERDKRFAKVNENTDDKIKKYDEQKKLERSNADKASKMAKDATTAATETTKSAATVSEKLIQSSSEFIGLTSSVLSGQDLLKQSINQADQKTEETVAKIKETSTPIVSATPISNGVKSSLINTPNTETTTEKKEDPTKTLLEQLILLNKTSLETSDTEKQQLILLQALVEVNKAASDIIHARAMTSHLNDNNMRAPDLTRAQFFQRP